MIQKNIEGDSRRPVVHRIVHRSDLQTAPSSTSRRFSLSVQGLHDLIQLSSGPQLPVRYLEQRDGEHLCSGVPIYLASMRREMVTRGCT